MAQDSGLSEIYEHAKSAEQSGDYKTAAADYERIIKLSPAMAEAYANAGSLYYAQGETVKAEARFRKAITLKPALSGPYFFLGLLDFKKHAYREALAFFEQAETRDPSNQIVESYLGYTQYAVKDYEQAAAHLERAANSTPKDIDVFYHLSKVYAELAKQDFQSLDRRFPESLYLSLATAHLYEAQKNWPLAARDYGRAAAKQPGNKRLQEKVRQAEDGRQEASGGTGASVDLKNSVDGALALFYQPPPGDKIPDTIRIYQERAQRLRGDKTSSAEELYELTEGDQALSYLTAQWVFEIDPDSYRAHQMKGQYYEEAHEDEKAIAEYRKALAINAQLPNLHFLIGNLYWKSEKPEQALPELQAELESDPNNPQALYELGDIFAGRSAPAQAESCLLRAIEIDPRMEEPRLALAALYAESRRVDQALAQLQKAAEINPADPAPHYRLSKLYQQTGRAELSRTELARFSKLKGELPSRALQ